ncbi:hypothetical protein ACVRZR_06940 [Streptococcus entericus]|uniref:hypothetical protein n=1 Tax=Streptococcus entericus TaxID=155680 RepID=UPI00036B7D70|nr:hypothetical protein [Streptococcus entericus]
MAQILNQDQLYDIALQTISAASQLPLVRVDREEFLKKQFKDSPYLDQILVEGPQVVYTVESLQKKADKIISEMTTQTSLASFIAGLPANPFAAVPLAGADVTQFFGFALNLAQQLAYLYGQDDLFEEGQNNLSEEAKLRLVVYLGAMFGVAGVNVLIPKVAKNVGQQMVKNVARQAITRTTWYPLIKKVGSVIGVRVTRTTVQNGIMKAIPIVGGILSGGLTYTSFKPMGKNLSQTFVEHLAGAVKDDLELNPEFVAQLSKQLDRDIEDAEFSEKS